MQQDTTAPDVIRGHCPVCREVPGPARDGRART